MGEVSSTPRCHVTLHTECVRRYFFFFPPFFFFLGGGGGLGWDGGGVGCWGCVGISG